MQLKSKKLATLLGVTLGLTLLTTPAHAGFIVAAVAVVVSYVAPVAIAAATATAIATVIVGAVAIGGAIALSKKMKESMAPDMGSAADFQATGAQGIMVNKTGSSQSIPVIHGETRTGGIRVFAETEGTVGSGDDEINNAYLHVVYVIGEGEMNRCSQVLFDGVVAATTSTTGASDPGDWSVNAPWSDDGGKLQVYFRPGTDSQSAISSLTSKASWTDPRFRGLAYAYLRLEYDSEVWTNGLPEVTFQVQGVKVASTSDGTSLSYSHNPARCVLNYLVNTRYGKGIDPADLDLPSFASAETYCDSHGFHCRGNVVTSGTLYSNLIDLLSSCRGYIAFGNKYRLLIDKASSETPFEITEANTIGSLEYSLSGKETMFNKLTAKFLDEDTEYKDNVKVLDSSALRTKDNGMELEAEIPLPFTKTLTTVTQMLTEEINQSRQSHTIGVKCTVEAINLEVGDLVNVTNETFGITQKTFRVLNTVIESNNEISLLCKEYDADVYGSSIITDELADNND